MSYVSLPRRCWTGCGAGRIAVALARRGYHLTGVDVSDGLLQRARGFAEECGVTLQLEKVEEMARIIKPGGVLVMTGHVVPSEAEALDALQQDPQHARASAAFNQMEPLDTFSAGEGFVHWFTREQLISEIMTLGRPVEVADSDNGLQVGVALTL